MWSVTSTASKQMKLLLLRYSMIPIYRNKFVLLREAVGLPGLGIRPPWYPYTEQHPIIHAQNTDLNQGTQRPKPMQSPKSISTNITQYFALYFQYCQNGSWWEAHQMISTFTKTPRTHRRASNVLKIRTILHLSHPSIQWLMEAPSPRVVAGAWCWPFASIHLTLKIR
jgi:hypothetical protein